MDSTIMLKEEIVKASNNIRKKYNMIRNQNDEMENLLETSFKPITTPLNALLKIPVPINKTNKSIDDDENHEDIEDAKENAGNENQVELINSLKDYVNDLIPSSHNFNEMDLTYGIRLNNNQLEMGNSVVTIVNNGDLKIKNINYRGSMGLYELIFKKVPNNYTTDDASIYKKMLIETSAFRKRYDPVAYVNGNRGHKYSNIISKIVGTKSGDGMIPKMMKLNGSKSQYTYWDNANELVDRLRLLFSSRSAGHNGHDNEILSIIEELREADLIL